MLTRLHHALIAAAAATLALTACTQELTLNLSAGQCVVLPNSNDIASVSSVDCAQDHHAEVLGTVGVTGALLPPVEELEQVAKAQCTQQFEAYIGTTAAESTLELLWLLPTETSWKTGDRAITCLAVAPNAQLLQQSVKGSKL